MQILSNYQLKKKDFDFLVFLDNFISKYPFKCYNLMDIFNKKDIVYIKDTTMIIDLIKLSNDLVVNIFSFFKEMLRNNLISKIIYKKEVLLVYFNSEFIVSFFLTKNKWLIVPLVQEFIRLGYRFYFDVFVECNEILELMFLVIIKDYYISIDVKETKKLCLNHYPLVINFYNNLQNNLIFSFEKNEFIKNFNSKLNLS